MEQIRRHLETIHEELDGIRAETNAGSRDFPELEDLFCEIADIADEIDELVIDAESIANADID